MTLKATLTAAFPEARRISNFLERDYAGDGAVVSLDERADGLWSVDAYFEAGEAEEIASRIRDGLGTDAFCAPLSVDALPETDWIAEGLKTLTPVVAGRFVVHGSHDRSLARRRQIAVEIDAGQAFGTGHHASTAGVLTVLDGLIRVWRFRRMLDLGTGSGVLAIALAKALRRPVLASDIDPVAVRVAAENTALNNVGALVRTIVATGTAHPEIRRAAPYDLVVANILAEPLRALAPKIAPLVAPGGFVVLSGIPSRQRERVAAAYRAQGMQIATVRNFDGWAVLVLRRPQRNRRAGSGVNRPARVLLTAAMFQNFTETADPTKGAERAALLRARLKELRLDGFIVPRADEHQGEYVPKSAARLAWLTGFTGSAGTALVLAPKAAIFVDGRYTLQVREQVDPAVFEPVAVMEISVAEWLKANASSGQRIGYDPWLMTRAQARQIAKGLETVGAELVPVDANPVDSVWSDRPAPPIAPVSEQPEELAGRAVAEKIAEISKAVADKRADVAVLTDPAAIAWLFNVRGGDLAHTPFPLAFAAVHAEGRPELFIDGRKLSNAVRDRIETFADVREARDFSARLAELGQAKRKVLYDPNGAAEAVARIVEASGGTIVEGADPVALPKARKSVAELAGSRAAHLRDGVAMLRFLRFIEGSAPGSLTEIDAAKKLEALRTETAAEGDMPLADISFESISSTGPNGAINHYRVTERTNRRLEDGELYLIDSGGQYRDGTTDITRTLPIGTPPRERMDLFRDRFTRVLKGHIAIALARFPKGTTGAQLDTLARVALWQAGLDFDHGTGHGVGAYLSVHEGPQRIAKTGHTPLEAGMIISNEPGYYRAGDFGIRIENLIVVREAEDVPGGDRPMHSFETVTLAPIDRRLTAPLLMTPTEIAWLDSYHQRVFGALSGWKSLTAEERTWLEAACRPVVG